LEWNDDCRSIFSVCVTFPRLSIVPAIKLPMNPSIPHYLLRSETSGDSRLGQWRFVLRPVDGAAGVEGAGNEPGVWGERLDLLTVVRALEYLDQPSWITLIGCTRYVEQGVSYGVAEWKENQWRWEHFGHMVPVRDMDLWQRMDRVLQFHRVDCGRRRFDLGHTLCKEPHWWPKGQQIRGLLVGELVKCGKRAMVACCEVWKRIVSGRQWTVSSAKPHGVSLAH
jgi:ribonuclease HI